jgi:hypothetical protein
MVVAVQQNYFEGTMRLSARNQIKGKALELKKGATTSHVRVEIAPGRVIDVVDYQRGR